MVLLKGLQKTTLVDYPGKVACTVFTAGCNFKCPFCQNPDLIEKSRYTSLETVEEQDFLEFLGKRKKWIEGVVISGGEPCFHKDLPDFMKKIKDKVFLVKLDTNGSYPKILEDIIKKKIVDFIAMDIKAPLEKYKNSAGVSVRKDNIKKSIKLVKEAGKSGIDYEFRITLVPGLHKKDDIIQIGKLLKGSKKIVLQQFENTNTYDPSFRKIDPYTEDEFIMFKGLLEQYVEEIELRI
ncbi:anaerobic ribonucleoside-triphosphate reductase activating protein [Thermoproteota archaeon]